MGGVGAPGAAPAAADRRTAACEASPVEIGEILARVDCEQLARSVLVALRERIPGYRRLPEAVLEDGVLNSARAALSLFAVAASGEAPDDAQLAVLRESARARAGGGVPLDDVL